MGNGFAMSVLWEGQAGLEVPMWVDSLDMIAVLVEIDCSDLRSRFHGWVHQVNHLGDEVIGGAKKAFYC